MGISSTDMRHVGCGHVQPIDEGNEVHEEIIHCDKGLLEKHVVLYLAMLW